MDVSVTVQARRVLGSEVSVLASTDAGCRQCIVQGFPGIIVQHCPRDPNSPM